VSRISETQTMRIAQHLSLSRHGIYYFRFPIPAVFHPELKRTDIKLSLNTRSLKEALHLSNGLLYLGSYIIKRPEIAQMEYTDIRTIVQRHFSELITKHKQSIQTNGRLTELDKASFRNSIGLSAQEIKEGNYSLIGKNENINTIIERYSLPITKDTADFKVLQHEFTLGAREYAQTVLSYDESYDGYNFNTIPNIALVVPEKPQEGLIKISDLIQEYLSYGIRLSQWKDKTVSEKSEKLKLLCELLPSTATIHLSTSDTRYIQNALLSMPKHIKTNPILKKMSVQDIIKLDKDHPLKKGKLLSPDTIKKSLSTYNSFMDWAVSQDYTNENNFTKLKSIPKKNTTEREPFTKDHMKLIISKVLTNSKPAYKWATLIACYTGARLEEIAQLKVGDIIQDGDVWYFDINAKEDKSVKSKAGTRKIPIHSKLIEFGFLDYHNQTKIEQRDRLFHQLTKTKNGYGRSISRWFNESFLTGLGIKNKNLVFHSFRHTVTTELARNDIEQPVIKEIIGHEQIDVTNKIYAHRRTLEQLKKAIETLNYV
jgi:integrase